MPSHSAFDKAGFARIGRHPPLTPASVRAAADEAVRHLGWAHPYYVDADHINLSSADRLCAPCDVLAILNNPFSSLGGKFSRGEI